MAKLDKLVASNSLRGNQNIMRQLEGKGEKYSVLWWSLFYDCERIVKRYPSLA